ncbi:MAG: guanylate kinase [Myxococcota bacterium]|nr:guanylate kinase [Myxococcota bacterium]
MSLDFSRWKAPDTGVLFVVTGASGSGKTTLVKAAFDQVPGLEFSVSATTRAARDGESDGVDYHFHSAEHFEELRQQGALLEWAEVYGNCYGTPREPVVAALSEGRSILLDIDVQGARQVRESYPDAVTVFILPPDISVLEARLRARSTDDDEVIRRRIGEARLQIQHCDEFDFLVVNDDLDVANRVFQSVLLAELSRVSRRQVEVGQVIQWSQ